jgi:hypothetical protein
VDCLSRIAFSVGEKATLHMPCPLHLETTSKTEEVDDTSLKQQTSRLDERMAIVISGRSRSQEDIPSSSSGLSSSLVLPGQHITSEQVLTSYSFYVLPLSQYLLYRDIFGVMEHIFKSPLMDLPSWHHSLVKSNV